MYQVKLEFILHCSAHIHWVNCSQLPSLRPDWLYMDVLKLLWTQAFTTDAADGYEDIGPSNVGQRGTLLWKTEHDLCSYICWGWPTFLHICFCNCILAVQSEKNNNQIKFEKSIAHCTLTFTHYNTTQCRSGTVQCHLIHKDCQIWHNRDIIERSF